MFKEDRFDEGGTPHMEDKSSASMRVQLGGLQGRRCGNAVSYGHSRMK
jgi:hypothetical protein